ncbi:MAG TPA: SRPBCC family protein, partial [Burkholderiales bacterium]
PAATAAEPAAPASIEVRRDGETYIVNGLLFAPVTRHEAWVVLTDFDHMGRFVPNLSESRVLRRAGSRLTVFQKGVARFGILSFPFESVREVELEAEETVRSRNISGNLRKLESLTRFSDADGATRISYRVEIIPDFWLPGFIGEVVIRDEIEEQFAAILKEMLRRRGAP